MISNGVSGRTNLKITQGDDADAMLAGEDPTDETGHAWAQGLELLDLIADPLP